MKATLASRSRSFSYNRISRPYGSRNIAPTATVSSSVFAGYELACADRRASEALYAAVLVLSIIATCITLVVR